MNTSSTTRRRFMAYSAGAAAALSARQAVGANDQIRLGVIGCGGRGQYDLSLFLRDERVKTVAICDPSERRIKETIENKLNGVAPEVYVDFRRLLDRDDIDCVLIATPDHWHALPCIYACQTGKDVYVEKPMTLTIAEGQAMVKAAHENNCITQVGTQQRSIPHFREAVERIQNGDLGVITHVECWNVSNRLPDGMGNPPDGDPPEGLNYDLWLGQAPMRPYNPNRVNRWRWFWDYSGGQMTDWGTHHMDIVQMALGQDYPLKISAGGGKYAIPDNRETPDTFNAIFEYDNNVSATYWFRMCSEVRHDGEGYGMKFYGSDAVMFMNRGGYEITPVGEDEPAEKQSGHDDTHVHIRNFIECMESRKRCNADVETGHRSTSTPHLANIAYWSDEKLHWDGKAERIVNHEESNRFISRSMRPPWSLG